MPSEQGQGPRIPDSLFRGLPDDSCPRQGPQSLLKDDTLDNFLPTSPSDAGSQALTGV